MFPNSGGDAEARHGPVGGDPADGILDVVYAFELRNGSGAVGSKTTLIGNHRGLEVAGCFFVELLTAATLRWTQAEESQNSLARLPW
jgi:hypothetical protein